MSVPSCPAVWETQKQLAQHRAAAHAQPRATGNRHGVPCDHGGGNAPRKRHKSLQVGRGHETSACRQKRWCVNGCGWSIARPGCWGGIARWSRRVESHGFERSPELKALDEGNACSDEFCGVMETLDLITVVARVRVHRHRLVSVGLDAPVGICRCVDSSSPI